MLRFHYDDATPNASFVTAFHVWQDLGPTGRDLADRLGIDP